MQIGELEGENVVVVVVVAVVVVTVEVETEETVVVDIDLDVGVDVVEVDVVVTVIDVICGSLGSSLSSETKLIWIVLFLSSVMSFLGSSFSIFVSVSFSFSFCSSFKVLKTNCVFVVVGWNVALLLFVPASLEIDRFLREMSGEEGIIGEVEKSDNVLEGGMSEEIIILEGDGVGGEFLLFSAIFVFISSSTTVVSC